MIFFAKDVDVIANFTPVYFRVQDFNYQQNVRISPLIVI